MFSSKGVECLALGQLVSPPQCRHDLKTSPVCPSSLPPKLPAVINSVTSFSLESFIVWFFPHLQPLNTPFFLHLTSASPSFFQNSSGKFPSTTELRMTSFPIRELR